MWILDDITLAVTALLSLVALILLALRICQHWGQHDNWLRWVAVVGSSWALINTLRALLLLSEREMSPSAVASLGPILIFLALRVAIEIIGR